MSGLGYERRRSEIETYFDRTAAEAWSRLTSSEPVGRIRQTVREGRDRMRDTLLEWLPADLHGTRILDAGCGTGMLAVELARRGADVLAIDLSPTLIGLARDRLPPSMGSGRVEFRVGDMSDPALGEFDHAVAMDSLIHYSMFDAVRVVEALAWRTRGSIAFTFAPRTPLLAAMRSVGRLFPRGNRAPWIEPMPEAELRRLLQAAAGLGGWQAGRTQRVASGFYTSQALELGRAG